MHIGLIIYGHLDIVSGGYLYNRQLVRYWRQAGHQVTVFSLPWRTYWRHFSDNWRRSWQEQVLAAGLDVLVEDELNHPSLFALNRRLQAAGVPVVSLVHLLRCSEPHRPLNSLFYREVERLYFRRVDGLIINSAAAAQETHRLQQREKWSMVAYPGRDHMAFHLSEEEIVQRGLSTGPLQILSVGNLIRRKGMHVLLEALSGLDPATWQLTAIGRQDMEPKFVQQLQQFLAGRGLRERVHFLGPFPFEQMSPFYRDHQLFVMPSLYEPFGIVYLEAMGAGLPVIGTTAGAGAELVEHGRSGMLVGAGAVDDLRQQIAALITDRERLVEMGLRARERYLRHQTWDETGRQITGFLNQVVAAAHATV